MKNPEAYGQLKQCIMQLLKDEVAEVRSKLLANIEHYLKTFAQSNANQQYLGILLDLLNDKNWKNRLAGIKVVESLIIKFPEEFGNDQRIIQAL